MVSALVAEGIGYYLFRRLTAAQLAEFLAAWPNPPSDLSSQLFAFWTNYALWVENHLYRDDTSIAIITFELALNALGSGDATGLQKAIALTPFFVDSSSPPMITFFTRGSGQTFIARKEPVQWTRDLLSLGSYELQLNGDKITAARGPGRNWINLTSPITIPASLLRLLPKPPGPTVTALLSAASFRGGPQAPGSIVSLFGSNLSGKNVSVTFDGIPAKLFYIGTGQINLQVPPELGSRTSAQMIVTADGYPSQPLTVALTPLNPAVFTPGIFNQDYSINSPSAPALVGSVVQIFLTGLTPPSGWRITAKLHDREIDTPNYAGPAPGLIGIQQVNLTVPADLPAMTTEVLICASNASGNQRVCSPPVKIALSTP